MQEFSRYHFLCVQSARVIFPTNRPGKKRSRVSAMLLLGLLISAGGCMQPRQTRLHVPIDCIQVTAASFTRPCQQRPDGTIVCDRVVVTATCVQAGNSH